MAIIFAELKVFQVPDAAEGFEEEPATCEVRFVADTLDCFDTDDCQASGSREISVETLGEVVVRLQHHVSNIVNEIEASADRYDDEGLD